MEEATINRQDIVTVDGLHYEQDHKLIAYEYQPLYEDMYSYESLMSTRVYGPTGVKYKWQPMASSTPYVEAECQQCGSTDFLFVTRSIKDAIKAGFLKLVAPVKR